MIEKTQTIPWKPFGDKHKDYITNALSNRMCVAEGAIRSGKTIDNCIIAAMYLETSADKIHLASGSTIANAKLNIGVCNGFGLESLFRGRCRWGKYKNNEALYIYSQTGEKIVLFSGGSKADSYKSILGNSYGLWFATEVIEHYDCDDSRESFIKVAFGRQIAADKPLTLWDLNPGNPNHRIYREYIDRYKTDYVGGYQYEHFTIADNLSITPERRLEIESDYKPGTTWYKRDILGQRMSVEGRIYPAFDEIKHCGDDPDYVRQIAIAVDCGHSNATVFLAIGIGRDNRAYILREYYHSGRDRKAPKSPYAYAKDYMAFKNELLNDYSLARFEGAFVDPSALGFIQQLRELGEYMVYPADHDVVPGIQTVQSVIDGDMLRVCRGCQNTLDEFSGYVWDEKASQRGEDKPIKENDHCMDAMRYYFQSTRRDWIGRRLIPIA